MSDFLIGYFKRVKSFVEQIINNNFNEQDMVDGTILYLAEYHIITAYRHKLFLAQNIIKDPNLIEGITSDLQLKKTCLNYFIKRKNKIRKHYQQILHDYNSEMTEIEQMEGDYYFLEHDNDMESELIKEIDQIFNNFQ